MKRPTIARIAHVEAARPRPALAVTVTGCAGPPPERAIAAIVRLIEIGRAVDAARRREGRSGS